MPQRVHVAVAGIMSFAASHKAALVPTKAAWPAAVCKPMVVTRLKRHECDSRIKLLGSTIVLCVEAFRCMIADFYIPYKAQTVLGPKRSASDIF